MPKKSKYPRLRSHTKRGKAGQVWTSWWYDMRGTGKRDIPLGTDYARAIIRWDELHNQSTRVAGTIEEAMAKWEAEVLPDYENPDTKASYKKQLARIRPVFGPCTWEQITMQDLTEYLAIRQAKTQANRELSVLSIIWNKARIWGMTVLPWPASGLERSGWKNKENARDVYVPDEQFDAIYRHADQPLRDAMDLATATGLRIKDVCAIRLTDFRQEGLHVKARKTGKRVTFTTADSDVLPRLLERRHQHKALHIFLLTSARGKPVTWRMLSDRFQEARAAAAKEVPACAELFLRDMRKRAAQLSEDLDQASKLLQHSSKAITAKHYGASDRVKPVR
jgi:integrase